MWWSSQHEEIKTTHDALSFSHDRIWNDSTDDHLTNNHFTFRYVSINVDWTKRNHISSYHVTECVSHCPPNASKHFSVPLSLSNVCRKCWKRRERKIMWEIRTRYTQSLRWAHIFEHAMRKCWLLYELGNSEERNEWRYFRFSLANEDDASKCVRACEYVLCGSDNLVHSLVTTTQFGNARADVNVCGVCVCVCVCCCLLCLFLVNVILRRLKSSVKISIPIRFNRFVVETWQRTKFVESRYAAGHVIATSAAPTQRLKPDSSHKINRSNIRLSVRLCVCVCVRVANIQFICWQ